MSLQRQYFLLSYLKTPSVGLAGSEPATSRSADRHPSIWANQAAVKYVKKAGADLGGGCRGCAPPPPEMTCGFLIQLVFCQKKNYVVYWCWSRADPETRAPPPKKNPGAAPERYAFFYFHLFHICRYQKITVITVFLSTKSLYFEGYMQQSWCSNVGLGLPMVYDINLVCKLKNNNPLGVLELLRPQWCIYVHLF